MDAARRKWSLTQEAFDSLLASLEPDRDRAAERYLEIRRNLVRLFEWRGCATPDEYADETLNRCAKRISEGDDIRDLPTYSVGVARMLLREMSRERAQQPHPLDEVPEPRTLPSGPPLDQERRAKCLDRCLSQLSRENQDLILTYYQGEKSEKIEMRRQLSQRFGVPAGTLRMRALRLREGLQLCAEGCLQQRLKNGM